MDPDVPYGTFDHMSRLFSTIANLYAVNESVMPLLSYFILKEHLSAYQIFKREKSINDKLIYKSTNKKVRRLLGLNLIERIKDNASLSEKELKRNAKYYKLTEEGLFALYIKHKTYYPRFFVASVKGKKRLLPITLSKNFLLRYNGYDFYKFCLYPWMNLDTIAKCSPQFAIKIHGLLGDISLSIGKYLASTFYEILFSPQTEKHGDSQAGIDEDNAAYVASLINKCNYVWDKNYNITIPLKYDAETVSLPNLDFDEKKVMGQMTYNLYKRLASFNFKFIYYRAVFSLVIGNIKEEDREILQRDLRFKGILNDLKKEYHANYNLLYK
jgi:hypothetical protein